MGEEIITGIRPALETLRELDQQMLLDKIAVAIHDATSAVTMPGKPAKVLITLDLSLLTQKHLSEPVMVIEASVETKLPKPDLYQSLFFIDSEGNPSKTQRRQSGFDLTIAPHKSEVAA